MWHPEDQGKSWAISVRFSPLPSLTKAAAAGAASLVEEEPTSFDTHHHNLSSHCRMMMCVIRAAIAIHCPKSIWKKESDQSPHDYRK